MFTDSSPQSDSRSVIQALRALAVANSQVVIDLFRRAAEVGRSTAHRQGATLQLPPKGRIIVSGDLHDHAENFYRLVRLAGLTESPDHHLVIQEVVHGPNRINGQDLSVRILARVAALQVQFPNQVHILLGNHELAQMTGDGIIKDGVSVVDIFDDGLEFLYQLDADDVHDAMATFIRSMLLAIKLPNDIMLCHSLPSPRKMHAFDPEVLHRTLTDADYEATGSAHHLVWGRHHTEAQTQQLAQQWGVKWFIMGHQPAEMGWQQQTENALVLNSDHGHGMALPIDLDERYTMDDLVNGLVPLAGIPLPVPSDQQA